MCSIGVLSLVLNYFAQQPISHECQSLWIKIISDIIFHKKISFGLTNIIYRETAPSMRTTSVLVFTTLIEGGLKRTKVKSNTCKSKKTISILHRAFCSNHKLLCLVSVCVGMKKNNALYFYFLIPATFANLKKSKGLLTFPQLFQATHWPRPFD